MDYTVRTTEEFIEELRAVAVVEIRLNDNGLEFLNSDNQILFTIPFAKGEIHANNGIITSAEKNKLTYGTSSPLLIFNCRPGTQSNPSKGYSASKTEYQGYEEEEFGNYIVNCLDHILDIEFQLDDKCSEPPYIKFPLNGVWEKAFFVYQFPRPTRTYWWYYADCGGRWRTVQGGEMCAGNYLVHWSDMWWTVHGLTCAERDNPYHFKILAAPPTFWANVEGKTDHITS